MSVVRLGGNLQNPNHCRERESERELPDSNGEEDTLRSLIINALDILLDQIVLAVKFHVENVPGWCDVGSAGSV